MQTLGVSGYVCSKIVANVLLNLKHGYGASMNEKSDTTNPEPSTTASKDTSSKAPEGSTLRFYQDEKERNAWFYRWLWRGMAFAILPSIVVAKNLGLVLYLDRFIVAIGLILALMRMLRDRKSEESINTIDRNAQDNQEIGWIEKAGVFIGGIALGMIVISVLVQLVLFILKK
jgi:hypothetical protein